MCGRFTLTVDPADLQKNFDDYKMPPQFAPRFNIAPTQPVLAIPTENLDFVNKPKHLDIVVARIMDKLAGKEDVVFPPNGG